MRQNLFSYRLGYPSNLDTITQGCLGDITLGVKGEEKPGPMSFATDPYDLVDECARMGTACPYSVGDERVIPLSNGETSTLAIYSISAAGLDIVVKTGTGSGAPRRSSGWAPDGTPYAINGIKCGSGSSGKPGNSYRFDGEPDGTGDRGQPKVNYSVDMEFALASFDNGENLIESDLKRLMVTQTLDGVTRKTHVPSKGEVEGNFYLYKLGVDYYTRTFNAAYWRLRTSSPETYGYNGVHIFYYYHYSNGSTGTKTTMGKESPYGSAKFSGGEFVPIFRIY